MATRNERYPLDITLNDGRKVQLRLMTADDRDRILKFARSLPEEDLLFLRIDLTQDDVVDDWIANLAAGSMTSLVAYNEDDLVGYATVHQNTARWTRRVGEIRVNIGTDYRGKGLGKNLTSQIFDVARDLGLRKVMANMTVNQHGAQAAFRRLGFMPEALLADYVEDRNGELRDLIIMSYDVEGLTNQMDEPLAI
jgi:RimJ/RimL family protein N-acetyltransferase